jgi:hypothetical protein
MKSELHLNGTVDVVFVRLTVACYDVHTIWLWELDVLSLHTNGLCHNVKTEAKERKNGFGGVH